MKDYFSAAFVRGFIAGVIKDILDASSYYIFKFSNYRYFDYAAMVLYGDKPNFWWDTLLAIITELMFCGILAVPFAYLLQKIKMDNLIFKGYLYGLSLWLFFNIIGYIFKLKFFTNTPWQTSTSDMITSAIYGIVLAVMLKKLAKDQLASINR